MWRELYLGWYVMTMNDLPGGLEVLHEVVNVLNDAVLGGARDTDVVPDLKVLHHLTQAHTPRMGTHRHCQM